MNKIASTFVIAIIISSSTYSEPNDIAKALERPGVSIGYDETGNFEPDLYFPMNWVANWSSGIGFRNTTRTITDTVEGFSESRYGSTEKVTGLYLSILKRHFVLNNNSFSIGLRTEYDLVDLSEFGYIHFPPILIDDYVAFDNSISIEQIKPAIDVSYRYRNELTNVAVKCAYAPTGTMGINQNTSFKPIVAEPGIFATQTAASASLNANTVVAFLLANWILSASSSLIIDEYKYDIKTLNFNPTSKSFSFASEGIHDQERTIKAELRIGYNFPAIIPDMDLNPQIGVGWKQLTSTDLVKSKSKSQASQYAVICLEKYF